MKHRTTRRALLRSAAIGATMLPAARWVIPAQAATESLSLGAPAPFSFDRLIETAKTRAGQPYKPPYRPAPDVVSRIDYDAHGKIRFKTDLAPFADGPGFYPITFFHLGQFFQKSVKMHLLKGDQAREILYSPDYFDMPKDSIAHKMPGDSGFAGFRLQESRLRKDWTNHDWVAFLGASYFRAIGQLEQFGLSARGLAVDVAAPAPEEFPDFVEFYIGEGDKPEDPVMIYALLDGPSVSGAYRFAIRRTEGVLMEIDSAVFMRKAVHRLGISPLTSMFWTSEYTRSQGIDWRPEVHDSDGLAMWTGTGERIWRPLNNPGRVITSSFVDDNPRGFGLLQRDRNFEHFLDGVNYDRRPSLWVEPLGQWGAGAVQLVEIPTDDEIHDNIVAFWVPKEPASAGTAYRFKYRLYWLADEPFPADKLARIVATRSGRGGEPGKPRPPGVRKFVVEFAGPAVADLEKDDKPKAIVTASRGEITYNFTERIPNTDRWRAQFDLTAEGNDPVEMRCFLRLGDKPLSETWLYQYLPGRG